MADIQSQQAAGTGLEFPTIQDLLDFCSNRTLLNQRYLVFSETHETIDISGVGTGKTAALACRAIMLSWSMPGNYGLVARATKGDLEATTQKDFFEIFPDSLRLHWSKSEDLLKMTSRGDKPSHIAFRHMRDARPGKGKHLAGLNLGWYSCDQAEELEKAEWEYLSTRLRRQVNKHYAFGIANPNGRDWMYYEFIEPALRRKNGYIVENAPGHPARDKIARVERWFAAPGRLAIRAPTHINIHLPEQYLENLLRNKTKEYIDRYVDGSFEDWGGRIYKEFKRDSVHVIHPFPIPQSWPCIVSIDVGGDSPWAIVVGRHDPQTGDIFITNELFGPGKRVSQIVEWMGNPTLSGIPNLKKAHVIVDPENKPVITEFISQGVMVGAAKKGPKVPGILSVAEYLHRNESHIRVIPRQPDGNGGYKDKVIEHAPHLWFFNRCHNAIREHEAWQWLRDPRTGAARNQPVDADDHTCDAVLYMLRLVPPVQKLPKVDADLALLRARDPSSAAAEEDRRRIMQGRKQDAGIDELWAEAAEKHEKRYKRYDTPWVI